MADEQFNSRRTLAAFERIADVVGFKPDPVHRQNVDAYKLALLEHVALLIATKAGRAMVAELLNDFDPPAAPAVEQLPQSQGGIGDGYRATAEPPMRPPTPMAPPQGPIPVGTDPALPAFMSSYVNGPDADDDTGAVLDQFKSPAAA